MESICKDVCKDSGDIKINMPESNEHKICFDVNRYFVILSYQGLSKRKDHRIKKTFIRCAKNYFKLFERNTQYVFV